MKVSFGGCLGISMVVNVVWRFVSEYLTTCTVTTESGLLVGHGTTIRNPIDWPNREKAEKVSMERAIAHLTKEARTKFWEAYRVKVDF